MTPLNAFILAEVIEAAGVFNLITGTGPVVGEAIAAHPGVDMVSFTGSTRAGKRVSELASGTVKPVAMELGGKSPNLILDDAEAERLAAGAAEAFTPGDPFAETTTLGPLVSDVQRERVRAYIETGIAEGAKLVTGGVAAVTEPLAGKRWGVSSFTQRQILLEPPPEADQGSGAAEGEVDLGSGRAGLEPDAAAVGLDDRAGDRQAEAGAVLAAGGVAAVEGLEDALAVGRPGSPRRRRRPRPRRRRRRLRARTVTLPSAGVWRIAFWIRLKRTRWTFSALAWARTWPAGSSAAIFTPRASAGARIAATVSPIRSPSSTWRIVQEMSPASIRESSKRSSTRSLRTATWVRISPR